MTGVPVAGDWDGDGVDGPGSYPVVGDWEPDGDDTVGVRKGAGWSLNHENDASAAGTVLTFGTGAANQLPVVWPR